MIELRPAEDYEQDWGCNTAEDHGHGPVEWVLMIGIRDSGYAIRLCGSCAHDLRQEVTSRIEELL